MEIIFFPSSGLRELSNKYGATLEAKSKVSAFFETNIKNAIVETSEFGDFISVTASIEDIEIGLRTNLGSFSQKRKIIPKNALRATTAIYIPDEVQAYISFISLNSPANFLSPREIRPKLQGTKQEGGYTVDLPFNTSVSVNNGNEEALLTFRTYCGDGSLNVFNPPCGNLDDPTLIPTLFEVVATAYSNERSSDPVPLTTDPLTFSIKPPKVYCYNNFLFTACDGTDGYNCTCTAKVIFLQTLDRNYLYHLSLYFKVAPLPKYTQLRVNLTTIFSSSASYTQVSNLFALTDVATASFLSNLYSIPKGLSVKHGSNQSVAEFYGEVDQLKNISFNNKLN